MIGHLFLPKYPPPAPNPAPAVESEAEKLYRLERIVLGKDRPLTSLPKQNYGRLTS